jgi:DNA mismatch repair ATPase MutS
MALSNIDANHLEKLLESKYNEPDKIRYNEDLILQSTTQAKLDILFKQLDTLRNQILEVAQEANVNNQLNQVKCSFRKVPGNIYYLYCHHKKEKLLKTNFMMNECYFSMLSPSDWKYGSPNIYINSYQYNLDSSWTQV